MEPMTMLDAAKVLTEAFDREYHDRPEFGDGNIALLDVKVTFGQMRDLKKVIAQVTSMAETL